MRVKLCTGLLMCNSLLRARLGWALLELALWNHINPRMNQALGSSVVWEWS